MADPAPHTLFRHMTATHLPAFINLLAERRKVGRNWAFVHLKVQDGSTGQHNLGELIQVLEHAFQAGDTYTLRSAQTHEVFMVTENAKQNVHQLLEGLVRDHISTGAIKTTITNLTEKGLIQVQQVLSRITPPNDRASKIGLVRLARMANVFLVLDDDPMMLKQMDHMLKAFGHVETFSMASAFLEAYLKYAPNAVFVDVHLKAENGAAMTGALIEKVDPFAHVVMISADAVKDTIIQSKTKGAKGFLGKPVSKELLFRYVLSAPTFVQRQA